MEGNIQKELEQVDLSNQMINLNYSSSVPQTDVENQLTNSSVKSENYMSSNPERSAMLPTLQDQVIAGVVDEKKNEIASNLIDSVGMTFQKTWVDKMLCCLDFLRKYFTITTDEVRQRLIHGLIPFNSKFYDISVNSPDLYGPFWIYTTLIFVIAAGGSLSKYFQGKTTSNFFQQFVPVAGAIIYTIGFGLPFVIYIFLKCFGESTSYFSIVCVYGYSLTVFIPIMLVCSCGFAWIQWILLLYGAVTSTGFILVNYWRLLTQQNSNKKYGLIGIIVLVQLGLFLTLKLYFFKAFQVQVNPNEN